MPIHFNDGLDDQLGFDGSPSFVKGQASYYRANLLDPAQAAALTDVDIEKSGVLKSRRSFRAIGDLLTASSSSTNVQGLIYVDSGSSEHLCAFVNGYLYAINTWAGTWTQITGGAVVTSATDPVYAAQIGDWLLFTDSTSADHVKGIQLPLSGGSTLYTATNASTPTNQPVGLRYLIPGKHQLWGIKGDDEVFVSTLLPDLSTATDIWSLESIRISDGDGAAVTGVHRWNRYGMVFFKEGSVWGLELPAGVISESGAGSVLALSDLNLTKLSDKIGCVSHRSVAQVGEDLFFLSRDGVRTVQRTLQQEMQGVGEPVSQPINDVIESINWAQASQACATFWNNRYILAVPTGNSSTNDTILAYHTISGGWTTWTNVEPYDWAIGMFGGASQRLASLDSNGMVMELRDYVEDDSTTQDDYLDKKIANDSCSYAYVVGGSGGSGYAVSDVLTVSGGTGTATQLTVATVSSAGAVETVTVSTPGSYSAAPTQPVSVTGGGGSGAQFNLLFGDPVEPNLTTKAYTWADQISPKKPDFLELEWYASEIKVDVDYIRDGRDAVNLTTALDTRSPAPTLPVCLPFYLAENKVIRHRISMLHIDPAREFQLQIYWSTSDQHSDAAEMALRTVTLAGYTDTLEVIDV